jgi:P pilus assembly chaperone PapD
VQVSAARNLKIVLAALIAVLLPSAARAELVLSELIVELQPGKQVRGDVEVWNNAPERAYVAIEPREIINPSLASQHDRREPDPEKLGLLVSPSRMILEPGARKIVRLATLLPPGDRERVYRVTVRPLVGGIDSGDSGLKILVGYDLLVLVRPSQPLANVTAVRSGRKLTFGNGGNVSVELTAGRQCDPSHARCTDLPGKRLYPGASWTVELGSDGPAEYVLRSPGRADRRVF